MSAKGELFGKPEKPDAEDLRRMALRERTLELELPARLLRKGVNVLALEIVHAPYHKIVDEKKQLLWNHIEWMYAMSWNTCEISAARLSADEAFGVESSLARPPGLQVWNSNILRTDFQFDCPALGETLRPISITVARNGAFSDKVVVSSEKPIRGLKAVAGELRGPGGTIPSSALCVRYAAPGGAEFGVYDTTYGRGAPTARGGPAMAGALSFLLDAAPASDDTAPAGAMAPIWVAATNQFANVLVNTLGAGAVVPIWVTAKVPPGTKAGDYEGKLSISCEGQKQVDVPIKVAVADWTLPDPEKYQTWAEIMESPDTLQLEYGVPAWSDKHFDLIARSFRLMRSVGSGVLYLPLIARTNYGNEESIVRWVKKGENEYDFDFTALDKYLDVAEKNLGKPKIVCFIVWDIFLLGSRGFRRRRPRGHDGHNE